jgi:hypothetical protein
MAFSTETLIILRNFAKINPAIVIYPGNELRTLSIFKDMFAKATIQQTFSNTFAIINLKEFLSTYSSVKKENDYVSVVLEGFSNRFIVANAREISVAVSNTYALRDDFKMPEPIFELADVPVIVMKDSYGRTTSYYTTQPKMIISPGPKNVQLPQEKKHTKFFLEPNILRYILDKSSKMNLKHLNINKEGLRVCNNRSIRDTITVKLEDFIFGGDELWLAITHINNLMRVAYFVEIAPEGLAKFEARGKFDITYYIALANNDDPPL